jgi:hypothetical protein
VTEGGDDTRRPASLPYRGVVANKDTAANDESVRYEFEGNGVRYKSGFSLSPVGQILAKVLRRSGLDQKLAKYQFIEFWPQIVGKAIAQRAKPEAIRNRVLIVRVENSSWAQELSFQKEVIKNRLNNFLGVEQSINDIHFYVSGKDELANRRSGKISR